MTILIAAKDITGVHIIADTRCTAGNRIYDGVEKILEFKNFFLMIAGEYNAIVAAQTYRQKDFDKITVRGPADVINIVHQIESAMKVELGTKPVVDDNRDYIDNQYIVVTKDGRIFSANQLLSVFEHTRYAVAGSGSPYALGILDFTYICGEDNLYFEGILDTVAKFDNSCTNKNTYRFITT